MPRELLCTTDSPASLAEWEPSHNNFWWRPKTDKYPSTNELLPGDIFLFSPVKPTAMQSQIRRHQRDRGYGGEHSVFTHAAIWIGLDHLLCDSTPKFDVRVSSLEDHLDKTCILVRRVPGITSGQREAIVRFAVAYRGQPYSFGTIVREKWNHLIGRIPGSDVDEETQRGLICSTLCARAVAFGTETVSLLPADRSLVIPATISLSDKLVDVGLRWRKVDC